MTTRGFDSVPPCSYGDGAPAYAGTFGARYIDTTANQEYYYDGAAWQALGGGGAGGLPYTSYYSAPYTYWYVYTPYSFKIYNNGSFLEMDGDHVGLVSPYNVNIYSQLDEINIKASTNVHIVSNMGGLIELTSTGPINISSALTYLPSIPNAAGAAKSLYFDPVTRNVKLAP